MMNVGRSNYLIENNTPKKNGQKLSSEDYMNIGYMAGRYGISLDGNLTRNEKPQITPKGTLVNINSCTKDLFENNLNNAGIKFDIIA